MEDDIQNRTQRDSLPLFDDAAVNRETTSDESGATAPDVGAAHAPETAHEPPVDAAEPRPAPPGGTRDAAAEPVSFPGRDEAAAPVAEDIRGRRIGADGGDQSGFGRRLHDIRSRLGMSVSEVGESTKIRSIYIEAIEKEDYSSLPPVVYVLAYVKTLCGFYGVGPDETESMTVDIRRRLELECKAPGDPSKSVVDMELSEENPILLKRILLAVGAGLFVIAGLLTLLVLAIASDSSKTPPAGSKPAAAPIVVDEKTLLGMQPEPALDIVPLRPDGAGR